MMGSKITSSHSRVPFSGSMLIFGRVGEGIGSRKSFWPCLAARGVVMRPNAAWLILIAERTSPILLIVLIIVLPMEGSGRQASFLGWETR